MKKRVLITGGAGFIGSHLVDKLLEHKSYEVSIFDNLEEQVHGKNKNPPSYINKEAEFFLGSVTDYNKFKDLVKEHEIIIHFASMVGVGQSMYQIKKYIDNNILGLANLLDILVNSEHNIEKVLIASSNTVYGESKSYCDKCGVVYPNLRDQNQLMEKKWELICPNCEANNAKPLLTDEDSKLNPSSIYAFSKLAQEKMSLMISKTYGINITVLRFFLVYGTRQSLSNPYTGICGIFINRVINGKPPIIFEDGHQTRDFVNVSDICQASILALDKNVSNGEIFNVGTGIPTSIKDVAEIITNKVNPDLKPIYTNEYRIGDIRHCVADISKIKTILGYSPTTDFKEGIEEVINWIKLGKSNVPLPSKKAIQELKEKGLLK
jgi:dTDP-L-rhamnose 4-epimerase